VFVVFISLVFLLGLYTGCRLSKFPKLETYKLVNIAGLLYDFLGVVVISEMATTNSRWKKISLDWIAPGVLWLHMVFPLGAVFGGLAAALLLENSSGAAVFKFASAFLGYSMIPLIAMSQTVSPQFAFFRNVESRWRWFALLLLLTGVGLQLVAALMGLRVPSQATAN
jgi:hypothetical protein